MQADQTVELLRAYREGDELAFARLSEQMYSQLHARASAIMASERSGHTLQPTALVNEAFMRLMNADVDYQDRAHFFSIASRTMRRILVDHARSASAQKRGENATQITLDDAHGSKLTNLEAFLELDDALKSLSELDVRKAEILELQFFAGLKVDEIASLFSVSTRTIERDSKMARAWLRRYLEQSGSESE